MDKPIYEMTDAEWLDWLSEAKEAELAVKQIKLSNLFKPYGVEK